MNADEIEYTLHARCREQFVGVLADNRLHTCLPPRKPPMMEYNTDWGNIGSSFYTEKIRWENISTALTNRLLGFSNNIFEQTMMINIASTIFNVFDYIFNITAL